MYRLVIALSLSCLLGLPPAVAQSRGRAGGHSARRSKRKRIRRPPAVTVKRNRVMGGSHWRIVSKGRVMHVWRPRGFRRRKSGIVVYVHGYRSSADKTWQQTAIAKQFYRSRQNAIFLVVDGPRSPNDKVFFPALSEILTLAHRHTRIRRLPSGHIVAIGHSAAYRTIVNWLDYRYLNHVVLVDALYANGPEFRSWITTHKYAAWHKLILISHDTLDQTRRFLRGFRRVTRRKSFPGAYHDFSKRQKGSPVLFIRSQYGHSELVNSGKVIPILLRLTRLALIPARRR